jgi:hypothetical protein
MEYVVYHDISYATGWLSEDMANQISTFLKSKGVKELNASDLAKWMERIIEENKCDRSVVVFSQDIVPDTICHSPSPSSLVRRYLDSGGKIVWFGDNPFYYQGQDPSKSQIGRKQIEERYRTDKNGKYVLEWNLDGPYGVLGVIPVFMPSPSSKVKITKEGKKSGLKNQWYSNRPIIKRGIDFRGNLSVLGTSSPLYPISREEILLRKKERSLMNILIDSSSKILGLISAITAVLAALYGVLIGGALLIWVIFAIFALAPLVYLAYWYARLRKVFASAWLKNFNSKHPESGFLRLWDFEPYRIDNEMLAELYNVSIERTEQTV